MCDIKKLKNKNINHMINILIFTRWYYTDQLMICISFQTALSVDCPLTHFCSVRRNVLHQWM